MKKLNKKEAKKLSIDYDIVMVEYSNYINDRCILTQTGPSKYKWICFSLNESASPNRYEDESFEDLKDGLNQFKGQSIEIYTFKDHKELLEFLIAKN